LIVPTLQRGNAAGTLQRPSTPPSFPLPPNRTKKNNVKTGHFFRASPNKTGRWSVETIVITGEDAKNSAHLMPPPVAWMHSLRNRPTNPTDPGLRCAPSRLRNAPTTHQRGNKAHPASLPLLQIHRDVDQTHAPASQKNVGRLLFPNKVYPAKRRIAWTRDIRGCRGPLALSRAAGCGTGGRGKLFERSEFLPRRFRSSATGVVSAAGRPFL